MIGRWIGRLCVLLIRAYQIVISPHIGNCCRFTPSCSEYCVQSIQRFGALRGCWLGLKRLLRCNPFVPGGYDPVPERTGRKNILI